MLCATASDDLMDWTFGFGELQNGICVCTNFFRIQVLAAYIGVSNSLTTTNLVITHFTPGKERVTIVLQLSLRSLLLQRQEDVRGYFRVRFDDKWLVFP